MPRINPDLSATQFAVIADLLVHGQMQRRRGRAGPMIFSTPGGREHQPKTIDSLARRRLVVKWAPRPRRVYVALPADIRAVVLEFSRRRSDPATSTPVRPDPVTPDGQAPCTGGLT